ncbi:GAF and ANTAR domain-containing protein [Jatrophihabitans telluris]|uniref:GAF and ANTAR domain-containing protein n=1 Tax=Jatrophihabitans telluris TaxID=2038343 RepID=A0ABY4QZP1_9ACTN|nr:GAF and ANTAR domain-containing protein [Jatrophihabitans telluris]UQX88395.1 GAF and ANTAR domain-containing protein [Jatrophihabitans telluris]
MADSAEPFPGDSAQLFARIAHELAAQPDVQSTTDRIVALAKEVLACDSTAIWSLTTAGMTRMHSATDPALAASFNGVVNETREGVSWECLNTHTTVRVDDIRTDQRWPAYRAFVLSQPEPRLLSAVGYSLDVEDRNLGALVISSTRANHFDDERTDMGAVFAAHAAISMEAAGAADRVGNLERALESNRRIGIALGILMARYRVTESQAFDMVRSASQHAHEKLRMIAEHVVLTGDLPEWPNRRPS